MKKWILPAFTLMAVALFGCNGYGKKVTINDHLEIYVKNDATEKEGRTLGEYIATLDSSNANQKSIQLSKESDVYTIRLVIPEEHVNNAGLEPSFQAVRDLVRQNVFPGKNVILILTDYKFNDKKTVAETSAIENDLEDGGVAGPVDSTLPAQ